MKHLTILSFFLFSNWFIHAQNQVFDAHMASTTIKWTGKKIGGQHYGEVQLKSGFIGFKNGKPEAGKFEIDMNSIVCKDISDPGKNADLVNHLKSDDFFSVEKFPVSTLTLTRIVSKNDVANIPNLYTCYGNLSIKGKNHPVEFPATIEWKGKNLTASARFSIDRTKWDITYKSGTIFPSLADKAIADNIDFEINLKATAK